MRFPIEFHCHDFAADLHLGEDTVEVIGRVGDVKNQSVACRGWMYMDEVSLWRNEYAMPHGTKVLFQIGGIPVGIPNVVGE